MKRILSDPTIDLLEKGLQAASIRQAVIANNIANANTPGFKRSTVVFEEELKRATEAEERNRSLGAQAPGSGGLPAPMSARVAPRIIIDGSTSVRNDGNNVDIEIENALMAENQIWYSALTRQISEHFARLRMAISEGRR